MAGRKASVGIQNLIDRTSGPKLKATIVVDQVYAQDQHENLSYRHPRGGRAKYLEGPLFEGSASRLQAFANDLLKPGKNATDLWAKAGRDVATGMAKNAPVEFGDLKQSAGLTVTEGNRVAITEPPKQRRLSEQELDAKDYMRSMGLGYRR